ncbi:hypothetical protein ABW21_db0206196 [Orbilia brochopaga]|nr:hypothetical protein ABW21_db0206196 [Drechslerella brochopaga]
MTERAQSARGCNANDVRRPPRLYDNKSIEREKSVGVGANESNERMTNKECAQARPDAKKVRGQQCLARIGLKRRGLLICPWSWEIGHPRLQNKSGCDNEVGCCDDWGFARVEGPLSNLTAARG